MNKNCTRQTARAQSRECILRNKAATVMMLLVLLVGIFVLALNIQPVKATRYIESDFLFTEDLDEPLVVVANKIVIDGNGHTLTGTGSEIGILLEGVNNVVVKNLIITGWGMGVFLNRASANTVFGNTITNNDVGIGLNDTISIGNTLYHNNIVDNTIQTFDWTIAGNYWYEPNSFEGNYWSDYLGLDDGSGAKKHAIAGDGIGDTDIPWPYTGFDNYPFVQENYWELSTGIETPVGQDVILKDLELGIEVRFEDVTEAGRTNIKTSKTGPEVEQEFRRVSDYCILKTTAKSKEDATIEPAIYYMPLDVRNPDQLKLKHYSEKDDTWTDITKEVDTSAEVVKGLMLASDLKSIFVLMEPAIIPATIDIDPDTLNLKSNGEFLTAYIELPEGYSVTAIDTSTVQLEDIPAIQDPAYGFVNAPFIDYDGDGVLECMVKFDRSLVRDTQTGLNDYEEGSKVYELVLTLTGTVDIISFEGSDTIKVIQK